MAATLRSMPMSPPDQLLPGSIVAADWTRRRFLGAATAAGVLAACGGDDGPSDDATGSDATGSDASGSTSPEGTEDAIVGEVSVVRFFGPYFPAGAEARVPFGLADQEGLLTNALAPESIDVTVRDPDGEELTSDTLVRRGEGLARPYYAVRFLPAVAGAYDIEIRSELGDLLTQALVVGADDPVASAIVAPGEPMPAIDTPTVDDAAGVDPICTRSPPCDLHTATLAEVTASGRPSVVLVATPAFCQTVVCGPILDLLLDIEPDHPELEFLHLEVYADPANRQVPPDPDDFAPVIPALGLPFEPVLYTVDADGIIVERIDYIVDRSEMAEVVDRLRV